MEDLTISIGSLGNYPTLERCLQSIYAETSHGPSVRVWVVCNGSDLSDTPVRIARHFPAVHLIRRDHALGYCATHNLVLGRCDTRYVLVLDDDTIVHQGTLARMVAFMDANPTVGMAGCKTLNGDGSFQRTYGLVPSLKTELSNIFRPDSFWPESLYRDVTIRRDVEWLNGSFMFVRAAALREVGALDERYYTYVCEADWCHRMRQAGWGVVYVPDAQITHIGGEHSVNNKHGTTSLTNLVRYHVNRHYFFHKHYNRSACLLLRPIMICGLLLRIAHYAWIYARTPQARVVAGVKCRAFWESVKICLRADPSTLPAALNDRGAVAGDGPVLANASSRPRS